VRHTTGGSEEVTVGVPVHRGGRFVAETLHSIRRQTHRDLRVIISVDGPDSESEEACRPFLEDPRFRMVVQPRTLGWAQNTSWLMNEVQTPFWCYHPHDDLLDPRYLETLVQHARTAPEASIVYSDIVAFGDWEATLSQTSLTGTPFVRQLTQLVARQWAIAFRGLTRLDALRATGGVPTNEVDCYLSDTAWVSAAARYGEHHRVPASLYFKRYHRASVLAGWPTWPDERRAHAWIVHCADLLEQAIAIEADESERRLLWVAAAERVVSDRATPSYMPDWSRTTAGREDLLESFLDYVSDERSVDLPRLLGARWRRIRRWARELSLPR